MGPTCTGGAASNSSIWAHAQGSLTQVFMDQAADSMGAEAVKGGGGYTDVGIEGAGGIFLCEFVLLRGICTILMGTAVVAVTYLTWNTYTMFLYSNPD